MADSPFAAALVQIWMRGEALKESLFKITREAFLIISEQITLVFIENPSLTLPF